MRVLVLGMSFALVTAQHVECDARAGSASLRESRAVFVSDPRSPSNRTRLAGIQWPEDPDAACVAKRFADALLAREGARPVRRGKRQAARIELTVLWLPGGHHGYDEYWDPEREETRVDFAQVLVATGAAVVDPKPLQTSRRQVCGLRIGEEIAERGYRGAWAPALQMGSCGDLSVQWSIFLGEENAQALVVWIRDELACLPVACGGGTPEFCDGEIADLVRQLHEHEEEGRRP